MSATPQITAPPRPVPVPRTEHGAHLQFEDVHFRYPTRPDQAALHGISIDIAPGETVAIVGPSGAGKSTLIQLALRFYDPASGVIRLNGVPLPPAAPAEGRGLLVIGPPR